MKLTLQIPTTISVKLISQNESEPLSLFINGDFYDDIEIPREDLNDFEEIITEALSCGFEQFYDHLPERWFI